MPLLTYPLLRQKKMQSLKACYIVGRETLSVEELGACLTSRISVLLPSTSLKIPTPFLHRRRIFLYRPHNTNNANAPAVETKV